MQRRSRILAKASLLLGSTLVALLLAELALRLVVSEDRWSRPFAPPPWTWIVTDPVLSWKNQPGFTSPRLRINSLGFRGDEIHPDKPPGVIRIACLGDSVTFGVWRENADWFSVDSFVEELAVALADAGRDDVEVINAGVLGYSSSTGLRQLQTRILPLDPDVVVARFGFNEHSMVHEAGLLVVEPAWRPARALLYGFVDWKLLRLPLLAWRRLPIHGEPYTRRWVEPERFEKDLRRFAELGRIHDFELLFLDYPLRSPERGESPGAPVGQSPQFGAASPEELHEMHQRYQEILRRTAREEGVPLLLTAPYCRLPGDPCFGDFDLVHPSRFGARLFAKLLHEELLERGWLEPRDG